MSSLISSRVNGKKWLFKRDKAQQDDMMTRVTWEVKTKFRVILPGQASLPSCHEWGKSAVLVSPWLYFLHCLNQLPPSPQQLREPVSTPPFISLPQVHVVTTKAKSNSLSVLVAALSRLLSLAPTIGLPVFAIKFAFMVKFDTSTTGELRLQYLHKDVFAFLHAIDCYLSLAPSKYPLLLPTTRQMNHRLLGKESAKNRL